MLQINMQSRVNGEQAMMVITRGRQFIGQRKERVMGEVMIECRINSQEIAEIYTQSKYLIHYKWWAL